MIRPSWPIPYPRVVDWNESLKRFSIVWLFGGGFAHVPLSRNRATPFAPLILSST